MGQAMAPSGRARKKARDPCHLCGMTLSGGTAAVAGSIASSRGGDAAGAHTPWAEDDAEVQALLCAPNAARTSTSSASRKSPSPPTAMLAAGLRAKLKARPPADERWKQVKSEWEKSVVAEMEAEQKRTADREAAMSRDVASAEQPPLSSGLVAPSFAGPGRSGATQSSAAEADDREEERRAALRMIALDMQADREPANETAPSVDQGVVDREAAAEKSADVEQAACLTNADEREASVETPVPTEREACDNGPDGTESPEGSALSDAQPAVKVVPVEAAEEECSPMVSATSVSLDGRRDVTDGHETVAPLAKE